MKEYEYITLELLILSYMDKFKTTCIDFLEIKRWANYIKKNFKCTNLEVVPLLTKQDILNFESNDILYKSEKTFYLKENKTLEDVYSICGKMPQRLLLMFTFCTDKFFPRINNENTL